VAAPKAEAPPPEPPPKAEPDRRQAQREAEAAAERDAEIAIARERVRKQREEADRKKRDAADKAEQERKAKLEKARLDKELAAKEARQAQQADARREALRLENLRRIQGMAGASGGPSATGNALQNAAPSSGYAGRIKARIRPLIIYTDDGVANPTAEIQVTLAPDGRILGTKTLKPSGDADWDKAVLRAIDKAESLPRDVDGRVPSVMVISFRPRE